MREDCAGTCARCCSGTRAARNAFEVILLYPGFPPRAPPAGPRALAGAAEAAGPAGVPMEPVLDGH